MIWSKTDHITTIDQQTSTTKGLLSTANVKIVPHKTNCKT